MRGLTKQQKNVLQQLYQQGARTESDLTDQDYNRLQKMKDFETLPQEITQFLWDYNWEKQQ